MREMRAGRKREKEFNSKLKMVDCEITFRAIQKRSYHTSVRGYIKIYSRRIQITYQGAPSVERGSYPKHWITPATLRVSERYK